MADGSAVQTQTPRDKVDLSMPQVVENAKPAPGACLMGDAGPLADVTSYARISAASPAANTSASSCDGNRWP